MCTSCVNPRGAILSRHSADESATRRGAAFPQCINTRLMRIHEYSHVRMCILSYPRRCRKRSGLRVPHTSMNDVASRNERRAFFMIKRVLTVACRFVHLDNYASSLTNDSMRTFCPLVYVCIYIYTGIPISESNLQSNLILRAIYTCI